MEYNGAIVNLAQVKSRMNNIQPDLKDFGVAALHVFGSVARGDERSDSDLDLLVDFIKPPTYDQYMKLKFYLEDLLGCPVDLLTRPAIRPEIRPFIEEDARRVA